MNTFFSPLRASSTVHDNSPTTVLKQYLHEQQRSFGKHAEVFIVSNRKRKILKDAAQSSTPQKKKMKMYAMKRQLLHKDSQVRALREKAIFQSLYVYLVEVLSCVCDWLSPSSTLYKASKCFNFIYMHDWFAVEGERYLNSFFLECYRFLLTATDSHDEPLFFKDEANFPEEEERKYPFMHFILECADKTVESCLARLSVPLYKAILFQGTRPILI